MNQHGKQDSQLFCIYAYYVSKMLIIFKITATMHTVVFTCVSNTICSLIKSEGHDRPGLQYQYC